MPLKINGKNGEDAGKLVPEDSNSFKPVKKFVSTSPFDTENPQKYDKLWKRDECIYSYRQGLTKRTYDVASPNEKVSLLWAKYTTAEFTGLLDEYDRTCFYNSIRVLVLEDDINEFDITNGGTKQLSSKSEELELMRGENTAYHTRDYKHIYNMLRSGDIDDNVLLEVKKIIRKYPENKKKQKEVFDTYWITRKKFHPNYIFIDSVMYVDLIVDMIKRMIKDGQNIVKIFTRNMGKINLGKEACLRVICNPNYRPHFEMKRFDKYTIAKEPAAYYVLKRKKLGKV